MVRVKLFVAAAAGALAALGGALFAHHNPYVEPRNFDIMLGVHSLAYALIGGLGTAFGPILGVFLDIGLLESSRVFQGRSPTSRRRSHLTLDTPCTPGTSRRSG